MTSHALQAASYIHTPNRSISIGDCTFAYRELGLQGGVPLIMLNHWGARLDDFDPRIVDGLANSHRVITTNYRGIGASSGQAPLTIDATARDTIAMIRALGHEKVNLFGFSLGGFVAQDIALKAPGLVNKLILTGTGPAGGGQGHEQAGVIYLDMLKGLLARRNPKYFLFFPPTLEGRQAATAFLDRLQERVADRDKKTRISAFLRQTLAIKAWGRQAPHDLSRIQAPTLIANGDHDTMLPTALSHDMARRIPNSELVIYEGSGHGGIFQYHADFVAKALAFLAK